MRNKLLIAAVLGGIVVGAWRVIEERQSAKHKNLASTEQFVSYASDQAIAEAQQFDAMPLDYSVDSLKKVDTILGRVRELYVKDPSSVRIRGISLEYGAYVGEVIRRHEPGAYWTQDSPIAGAKSYPLHWKDKETFPLAWCSKRIVNGDEDSIWLKYTVIKSDTGAEKGKAKASGIDKTHE